MNKINKEDLNQFKNFLFVVFTLVISYFTMYMIVLFSLYLVSKTDYYKKLHENVQNKNNISKYLSKNTSKN